MKSLESRELSDLRRDTLAAESFLASEHEAPKEVERVDESDGWPVRWCYCCHSRKRIPPGFEHCVECTETANAKLCGGESL